MSRIFDSFSSLLQVIIIWINLFYSVSVYTGRTISSLPQQDAKCRTMKVAQRGEKHPQVGRRSKICCEGAIQKLCGAISCKLPGSWLGPCR